MYIVIAGGGKVGYYLCKTLIPYKHKISIIETKPELCKKIADELNIPAFNGDGTAMESLCEVETQKADFFIAVTGKDEDNLVACQLAKKKFGVKRTIARVNNPKNIKVFEQLGVDIAVSSTSIIADLIEQEVDYAGLKTLMRLKDDKIVLSEIHITKDSPVCNKAIKDINLPSGCILISVIRDEEVIIPNGFTVMHEGDYIIAVSSSESRDDLQSYLLKNS